MKTRFITFAILACFFIQEAASATTPSKMNNIDYLAKGYNIYTGNPLSEKDDPGFTLPIFKFTYNGDKTGDGRYEIPKGISIDKQDSCDSDVKVEEMTTEKNYHNKLEIYASQEGSGGFFGIGASLSFNQHYQTIKDEKIKEHYIHIVSSAECSVYKGKINIFNLPALDDTFKNTLLKFLPEDYQKNKELYFNFLDNYGTHYVKEAYMGSRMAKISSLTEKDKKELVSKNVDIEASASASFLSLFSAKISGGVKKESSKSVEFDKKVQTHKESYIGSKPKGDFLEWANQAIQDPMPIKYKLAPLYSLELYVLGNGNFLQEEGVKVERVFANLKRATAEYCKEHLKNMYPGQSCEASVSQEKLPTYGGQCALCAKSCGDDYSIESGTLAAGKDSKNFQTLPQGCFGPIGPQSLSSEGAKLCCMPQSKEKPTESCRLCESCGGDFSSSRGLVAKGLKTDDWVRSYDKECAGNLRLRDWSKSGFEICCMKSSPCVLCTSCGGDYYETGVFGIREDNKKKYKTMGEKCQGPLKGGQDYKDGLKLCCAKNGKAVSMSPAPTPQLRPTYVIHLKK